MVTNNAINLNATGIAKYDGAGTFSAITTTIHQPVVGAAANGLTTRGAMTNGQLIIGSTGADPALAGLTAGTGIGIGTGAGTITINATGGGMTWTVVAGDTTLAVNNGYGSNKAGAIAFTLPASSAVGDRISIIGMQGSWNIVQGAGQQIHIFGSTSALGGGGSLASTNAGDAITIVCLVANTIWYTESCGGNITVT